MHTISLIAPVWSRAEMLHAVGAADGTFRARHVRGELPWMIDTVAQSFEPHPKPEGRRRYTLAHALAWKAAEALGLPLGLACVVAGAAIFHSGGLLLGSHYDHKKGLDSVTPFTEILANGGPYEDEPVLAYAVLAKLDADSSKSEHGEGSLYLEPVVGARSSVLDKLNQWRNAMHFGDASGVYARRIILVDLAGECRALVTFARSEGLLP